ncbi:hypothetical protein F0562_021916 [Nyssa sinensis]|uniref:Uncharacterized protein n=1 Tax=Nyssa sinensis TaxID=561372 RepID=A0A5J5BQ50_9ASTE|nr:hypothetical protein F0562_021916 [Nyssa sinensis]
MLGKKLLPLPPSIFTSNLHQFMPKMRTQTLIHLLLVWLLLTVLQHHYPITIKVQATDSVNFKLRPAQPSSRSTTTYILSTYAEEKKIHKAPSGPNPVGNHRPPSRP